MTHSRAPSVHCLIIILTLVEQPWMLWASRLLSLSPTKPLCPKIFFSGHLLISDSSIGGLTLTLKWGPKYARNDTPQRRLSMTDSSSHKIPLCPWLNDNSNNNPLTIKIIPYISLELSIQTVWYYCLVIRDKLPLTDTIPYSPWTINREYYNKNVSNVNGGPLMKQQRKNEPWEER